MFPFHKEDTEGILYISHLKIISRYTPAPFKKEHKIFTLKPPNMKKSLKITIWIIIFILLLITSFLIFKYKAWEAENSKICCGDNCFNLEIADTPESRELWLMYRETMLDEDWMLFVFDKMWTYSFWMKNTLIPLAGIRLDSDLKIVDIILMEPCKTTECPSYTPNYEAQYVLEINQWLISEKWLLHIWDECKLINSDYEYQ